MKQNDFFRLYWSNMKGKRALFLIGLVFYAALPLGNIIQSDITVSIIDDVFGESAFDILPKFLIALICIQLIRSLLHYILRITFHQTGQHVLLNIREKLYSTMQQQDMDFFKKYSTGELMSRASGDLDMMRFFLSFFIPSFLDAVVAFFSTLIYLLFKNPLLTLILLICTPPIFFLTRAMATKVRPYYRRMREKMADLNRVVQENIAGNRVVKAYAAEDYEIAKFNVENDTVKDLNVTATVQSIKYRTPLDFIATLMAAVALVGGGILAINGNLSIGELSIFISLSVSLSTPLRTMGTLVNDWERIKTSVERVIPIYYAEPTIKNPENPVISDRNDGEVTFENVTFILDNTKILDNISFTIKKGETLAVMGPTGSGKTFITNLILRLYDVTEGRILVDGIDVRDYDLKDLRRKIAVSTQDVFLFSETIEGNISYGAPDLSVEEVVSVSKAVQAYDFIQHTSDGFDTIIGERGVGLSGGQKQRLALARALAVHSPLLILDDTTSALDMETEHEIQASLREEFSDMTQIIIAQRISSVNYADKIIILQNGRISQEGTHAELITQEGYYKEIYDLQYGD